MSVRRQLTAAADRALEAARHWSLPCAHDEGVSPAALLLGLLAETESRAATTLAAAGIDAAAVCHRFPLAPASSPADPYAPVWSRDVEASLAEVERRLADYPRPLQLATEHLLLGLVAGSHETGRWLVERGLSPESLEVAIHVQNGHDASPIDADDLLAPRDVAPSAPPTAAPTPTPPAIGGAVPSSVYRVLDAVGNRGLEGLRILEDYARFVLDDRFLSGELKSLRHELAGALGCFDSGALIASRDAAGDVGAGNDAPRELVRADLAAIVAANAGRVQEALRSLEEFGKLVDVGAAVACKRLRYRVYTIEGALARTAANVVRLADARLYVLIDGGRSAESCAALAETLVRAGVQVIQLRDKRLADRDLLDRARRIRAVTRRTPTLFIVNDRPDVAALADADGVHIGQEELPVAAARAIVGPQTLVGVSTHSIEQARQAVLDGADYLGVGPTFPSSTKAFERFPGLELVRQVASEFRLPAFAIGGIDETNIGQVIAAGLRRAAVASAVAGASDPHAAARALLSLLSPPGGRPSENP